MAWGNGDDQQLQMSMNYFDTEEGATEAFTASFEESFELGPTKSIYRFVGDAMAKETMTGAEANEKYNLTGTEIAYDEGDSVSDFSARQAADRFFERRMNEATIANASEKPMGTIASFAGSLTAGFVDPVNIATGVGVASAIKTAGGVATLGNAMKSAVKNPWIESGVRNVVENFVATAAVDLVAVPLGEQVTRQETSTSQRIMNVVGGTLFGAGLGMGLEARGIMQTTRAIARQKGAVHGSKAADIAEEANEHALKNHANGKKPNPEFIEKKHEIMDTTPRAGQEPYVPVELNQGNVRQTDYFVGKDDMVMHSGDSGYVISDNANLVSNRVTPLDGSSSEMFHVKLSEDAKIVTPEIFEDVKTFLPEELVKAAQRNGYEGNDTPLLMALRESMDDAADIADIPEIMDSLLVSFKNMPDSADLLNSAIDSMGYDGYRMAIPHEGQGNAIVLLKKADGTVKGRASVSEGIPTTPFDPNHPANKGVQDTLSKHNEAEARRLADPRSNTDYNAEAVRKHDEAPEIVESDDFDKIADINGLDKDNLAESGLSEEGIKHAEALKDAHAHDKGGKALMHCILKRLL